MFDIKFLSLLQNIFENIKNARLKAGKTQQEVADLLGIKRTTYTGWESKVIPSVLDLIKLGELFSVDWTSLVKETITGEPIKPGNSDLLAIKENTEATRLMVEELLKKLKNK